MHLTSKFNSILSLLLILLVICCTTVSSHCFEYEEVVPPPTTTNGFITHQFYQAVDMAMSEMVSGPQWSNLFQSLDIPFMVPSCIQKFDSFPPNPFTKKQFNICYEEPTEVWKIFYREAGDMLVQLLNSKYPSAKLKANHVIINTTSMGYFDSLARAADSGLCDIVTSNVIRSEERSQRVNFNCPYGSSSLALLMSSTSFSNYTTAQDLMNAKNTTISVLKGSFFETTAKSMFPNSKLRLVQSYEYGFNDVAGQVSDGTIADAIDLVYWLNTHRQNCSSCFIKLFGNAYQYGAFMTMNVISGASIMSVFNIYFTMLSLILFTLIF